MTWQPIETAPKDGTNILLFYPAQHREDGYMYLDAYLIGWWNESEYNKHLVCEGNWVGPYSDGYETGLADVAGHETAEPSHWMPLPEPPDSVKIPHSENESMPE